MPVDSISRRYNLWVALERCPDIEGEWFAHCLEIDTMSQGRSLQHAMQMIVEAISIVLTDELTRGRDPLLRRAPEEDWQKLYARLQTGTPITLSKLGNGDGACAIDAQLALEITVMLPTNAPNPPAEVPHPKEWTVPFAARSSAPAYAHAGE